MPRMTPTLRVGVFGFDGVNAIDLAGPLEVFATANEREQAEGRPPRYHLAILGVTGKSFASDSGITFNATVPLGSAPSLDTVIIPGGTGLRVEKTRHAVADWLRAHAKDVRRICSVCTGIYGLASSGLLDGRRVTTHWRWAKRVAERFPALRVEPNAIFIQDGPFFTSAGVTAGIDLALALVEQDCGAPLALACAREMVVHLKRDGGQEQYSEPLQFQVASSSDRLAELGAWIPAHLRADLSVEALAAKACLSPRQFGRRFKQAFHTTPADFVERARLDEARTRLSRHRSSIAEIADSVGFASADAFRRAFERNFGVSPRTYRRRFVIGRGTKSGSVGTMSANRRTG